MTKPVLIDRPNLSLAWAAAFIEHSLDSQASAHALDHQLRRLSGDVIEEPSIRTAFDAAMAASEMQKVQTVANTNLSAGPLATRQGRPPSVLCELPGELSRVCGHGAEQESQRSLLWSTDRIRRRPQGRRATPIQYPGHHSGERQSTGVHLQRCKKGVRVSAFQASVFDPARDHTSAAQLGFPCLQHVTFVPDFHDGSLGLNAFYATQQLFEKGYGNYLGLARLGMFVAAERAFISLGCSCFVGVEKMESKPKAGVGT